jgi:hypothetical protein
MPNGHLNQPAFSNQLMDYMNNNPEFTHQLQEQYGQFWLVNPISLEKNGISWFESEPIFWLNWFAVNCCGCICCECAPFWSCWFWIVNPLIKPTQLNNSIPCSRSYMEIFQRKQYLRPSKCIMLYSLKQSIIEHLNTLFEVWLMVVEIWVI